MIDPTQASYMQPCPSTSQGFEAIPKEQHRHHHAPPPQPPVIGPPIKLTLKSNCLECQVKLKKKLQKMTGVKDVEIIPEQGGTVTVSGSIDPKALMDVIRTNYKKAELLCPVDKNGPLCSKTQRKKVSCSDDEHDDDSKEDDDHHNVAVKKSSDNDAGLMSELKNEEKKRKMCGIMRCFGKVSSPSTAMRPPPPRPVQSPSPVPRGFMGFQANNGFFHGQPRPGFQPGMPGMPPFMPPHGAPPPYGCLGMPPPPPMGSGYHHLPLRSPPRSNGMVHYTNYTDNFRYPYNN